MTIEDVQVGFNPCFRGCRSGTIGLVSGGESNQFQSLFSWMSLWNR